MGIASNHDGTQAPWLPSMETLPAMEHYRITRMGFSVI